MEHPEEFGRIKRELLGMCAHIRACREQAKRGPGAPAPQPARSAVLISKRSARQRSGPRDPHGRHAARSSAEMAAQHPSTPAQVRGISRHSERLRLHSERSNTMEPPRRIGRIGDALWPLSILRVRRVIREVATPAEVVRVVLKVPAATLDEVCVVV